MKVRLKKYLLVSAILLSPFLLAQGQQAAFVKDDLNQELSQKLVRVSGRISDKLKEISHLIHPSDQQRIMEQLRATMESIKSAQLIQNNSDLVTVAQQTFKVSRKAKGEWMTLKFSQASTVKNLDLRVAGTGSVRVYRVRALLEDNTVVADQSQLIQLSQAQPSLVHLEIESQVKFIQVLAEGFSADMNITVSALSIGSDQGGILQPPPPPIQPDPVVINPPIIFPPVITPPPHVSQIKFDFSCNGQSLVINSTNLNDGRMNEVNVGAHHFYDGVSNPYCDSLSERLTQIFSLNPTSRVVAVCNGNELVRTFINVNGEILKQSSVGTKSDVDCLMQSQKINQFNPAIVSECSMGTQFTVNKTLYPMEVGGKLDYSKLLTHGDIIELVTDVIENLYYHGTPYPHFKLKVISRSGVQVNNEIEKFLVFYPSEESFTKCMNIEK